MIVTFFARKASSIEVQAISSSLTSFLQSDGDWILSELVANGAIVVGIIIFSAFPDHQNVPGQRQRRVSGLSDLNVVVPGNVERLKDDSLDKPHGRACNKYLRVSSPWNLIRLGLRKNRTFHSDVAIIWINILNWRAYYSRRTWGREREKEKGIKKMFNIQNGSLLWGLRCNMMFNKNHWKSTSIRCFPRSSSCQHDGSDWWRYSEMSCALLEIEKRGEFQSLQVALIQQFNYIAGQDGSRSRAAPGERESKMIFKCQRPYHVLCKRLVLTKSPVRNNQLAIRTAWSPCHWNGLLNPTWPIIFQSSRYLHIKCLLLLPSNSCIMRARLHRNDGHVAVIYGWFTDGQ